MIVDHGLDGFKIIPDWFQKALPRERCASPVHA